jgi:titin
MTDANTGGDWSAADDSTEGAAKATTLGDVPNKVDQPTVTVPNNTQGTLRVGWTQLTGTATGGTDITGYDIQIWDSANQRWADEATVGDTNMYDDTGLAGAARHYYRVRARNSEGPGQWSDYQSNEADDLVPARDPDAPELMAAADSTTSIRLTWAVPNNNGTPIIGYVLQRWNTDAAQFESPATPAWSDNIAITGGDQTLYLDTRTGGEALRPGTTYYYRIRTNPADTANPAWSAVVTVRTIEDAPDRPQNPSAEADGENAIDLSWDAPASDGGNAIIHYHIEMWDSSSKTWSRVSVISATHTSYKHRGRTADTRYVYRVRAENRAALNDGLGPWSTITSATTDAAE